MRARRRQELPTGFAVHVWRRHEMQLRVRGWVLRMALAISLVVAAGMIDTPRHDLGRFGYLVGLAYVPAVGLVDAVRRRRPGWATDAAALTLDWSLIVSALVLIHPLAPLTTLAQLPLVAYYAHLDVRRLGTIAAGASLVTTAIVLPTLDLAPGLGSALLVLHAIVVLGLLWLQLEVRDERRSSASVLELEYGRSEAILTGVGEAVVVTGPRGEIRRFNRAAERTFGSPADDAVAGRCHEILALRQGLVELDCSVRCPLLSRVDDPDVEVWRDLATGVRQPLLVSAMPLLDQDGRVVEVVHSYRDLTRIKEADEAKTLFLATASHELRTPLTVIRGFAELLASRPELGTEEVRVSAQAIADRSRHLGAIVDRLLLSSQIEAGRVSLHVATHDVAPALRERVASLDSVSSADVVLDLAQPLPPARLDLEAFNTVMDHLLDNAIKYSQETAAVEVSARTGEERLIITVQDRGVGMTQDEIDRCFDRFWQAEWSETRRFEGAGMGLFIVKSLVDGMGGDIQVESTPGEGTRFMLSFDRADRDKPEDAARSERSIVGEFMRQAGVAPPARR